MFFLLLLLRRRAPLDLSLEFILSVEGAFVRRAAVSDLRSAAISSLRKFPRIFRGRRPSSNTPSPSSAAAATCDGKMSRGSSEDAILSLGGSEGAVRSRTPGGATTTREASRRLLRKRAFSEARHRPILVARVGVSIVAAVGRAMGTVRGRVRLPGSVRGGRVFCFCFGAALRVMYGWGARASFVLARGLSHTSFFFLLLATTSGVFYSCFFCYNKGWKLAESRSRFCFRFFMADVHRSWRVVYYGRVGKASSLSGARLSHECSSPGHLVPSLASTPTLLMRRSFLASSEGHVFQDAGQQRGLEATMCSERSPSKGSMRIFQLTSNKVPVG